MQYRNKESAELRIGQHMYLHDPGRLASTVRRTLTFHDRKTYAVSLLCDWKPRVVS